MAQPKLIGLGGLAGSGKTTIAWALQDEIESEGLSAAAISFADPLKGMYTSLLSSAGVPPMEIVAAMSDKGTFMLGRTVRHALQTLGTDWGRNLMSPTLWTDIAMQRAEAMTSADFVIFDDVRFPSEADAIHRRAGFVYRIERKGVEQQGTHASEGQRYQCIPVRNDGTPERLARDLARKVLT